MPEHAAASGSAAGAAIEGFLSGFHDITELRGRRSDRQRLAQLDEDERARLARLDAIEAEDRRLRHQDDERRRLIDEFMFLRDNPEVAFDTTPANGSDRIGSTRFRRGDSDEIIQGKVGQFRGNVGEELSREPLTERNIFEGAQVGQFGARVHPVLGAVMGAGASSALPRPAGPGASRLPAGMHSTGLPSLAERGEEREAAIMQAVANALGSGNPREFLSEHPDALDRLMGGSVLDDVLNLPGVDPAPRPRTAVVRSGDRNIVVDLDTGKTISEFDPILTPGRGGGADADDGGTNDFSDFERVRDGRIEVDPSAVPEVNHVIAEQLRFVNEQFQRGAITKEEHAELVAQIRAGTVPR